MPGGSQNYLSSLAGLLRAISASTSGISWERFRRVLAREYGSDSESSAQVYAGMACHLGLASRDREKRLTITAEGRKWLNAEDPLALFERLDQRFAGMLETLVIIAEAPDGTTSVELASALQALLGASWRRRAQADRRRAWLASMGLVSRSGGRDVVTDAGRAVVKRRTPEASRIRARLRGV